jgi:chemotaxis protein methyltransferase CheR
LSAGTGQRLIVPRPAEASRLESPQLSVSPASFRKFQKLIYTETGIWLGAAKTALLCGRLFRRLRALGLPSLEEYYERVAQPNEHAERTLMIDAITTNETRFFREPRHFEFLVQQVFPRWRAQAEQGARSKKVRMWSAGCSSGEEPYTLAMLLAEHLPAENGWDVQVLATDISTRVLEKASAGIYDVARSAEIPEELLHKFMLRGIAGRQGKVKVKIGIQQLVEFKKLNLHQDSYEVGGPFDVVLCRNVLIYFGADSKRRVVANLVNHLAADGLLFVGHAENLTSISAQLRSVEPTIYARKTSRPEHGANQVVPHD